MNVPFAIKEIGMLKFDYPEDYTGTNFNHRVISEKRTLTDDVSRIVTLDFGAFFAESLVIRNVATGRPLLPGKDYACVELDTLATELSGKQVCAAINVTNKQVATIEIDYIFVGGRHMSGLHLMKEVKRIYPNGLEPKYHWDGILNKPETFKPKQHNTHVKELYGFDGVTKSLDDMINSIGLKDKRQLNMTFEKIMTRLGELNVQLDQFIATSDADVERAFQDFRVQDNEYIFTNTKDNPALKRGYGTWVLVNNIILKGDRGDSVYAVGADSVISIGAQQMVTNCYVWKNQVSSKTPTYTIASPAHAGLAASQRNENQDIVINITTTNLASGTKLSWILIDATTKEAVHPSKVYGTFAGEVAVDAQGKAQVVVKFKPDTNTPAANKNYSFRLLRTANAVFNFTVVDSSLEKRIELGFSVDVAGKYPIQKVDEGQNFYLQIKFVGNWVRGEVAFLDWSTSGVKLERIASPEGILAPTNVVVPSSPTATYMLRVSADDLTDRAVAIVVHALQDLGETINSATPYALLEVTDTSKFSYAGVTFNDITSSKNEVGRVDEDVTFDIVISTNLPSTELNIIYNTTKAIKDFEGLLSSVKTNSSGKATIRAKTTADFLTNIGTQSLTVEIEANNEIIGYNTLFINDTSKTPNYEVFFSKENISQVITEVNEGDKFFLNVRVSGWTVGAKAPSLDFNYILNDVNNTSIDELKSRIAATFYPAMLFGPSSATYNEVTWVNGNTLRMEFTAIADKLVKGDIKLGVRIKQANQSQFDKATNLTIRDTSIPTVVGTWSSSSTQLIPLTQVDEMTSAGLNQRCYLWIDVDGDGSGFGNISLSSNSVNDKDFVTVFPRTIKMAAGASRHILTVDAKADFLAEGNKNIYVAGTYKNSRNEDVELFRATIMLVDNSVLTALTGAVSTSASAVTPAAGYSEWQPMFVHFDFPAYNFESEIDWRIVFSSNPSGNVQFEAESGTISLAKNASKNVLTLTPLKDRLRDGEATFTIFFTRKIKSTGQEITSQKSITGIKLLDDSLPMSVELKAFTDAARTIPAGVTVNEGAKLYLRAIVNNADRNYSVCFALQHAVVTQIYIGGAGTVMALPNTAVPSRVVIDDRKIVGLVPATPGASTVNIDAEITVVADRTTKSNGTVNPDGVAIEARVYDNSSNAYPVGMVVPFAQAATANSVFATAINDTSKTASYTLGVPSSVGEDTTFKLTLDINDGTIGDVYYPVLISGINANRFSINELGLEQLASTANSNHSWNFKVAPDYRATGPITLNFGIMNKTTGKQVIAKSLTLNDTTFEPDLEISLGAATDIFWSLGPMTEGVTHTFRVYSNNGQLYVGDTITIEWVSGRPASEFTGLFGSHVLTTGKLIVDKPVTLRADRKTNSAAENKVVIKVSTAYSKVSKNFTINIVDASQTPAIRSAVWKNAVTGATITQANEGDTVRLEVLTNGGTDPYGITLSNDGGRSVGRLDSHEYGVKKTRVNDSSLLSWTFRIKVDYQTNSGNETMLKVKLVSDAGNIDQGYTLPIYDNSKSTTGRIEFHPSGGTNPISTIEEGLGFGVKYVLNEPDPDGRFRLLTTSGRPDDGWKIDSIFNTDQFYAYGNDPYTYKLLRETTYNNTLNTGAALIINAELWDVKNNRLLAANSLNLIDTSRPLVPSASIRITTQGGAVHASSLNEGTTADVYILASAFTGIDWTKESVKVYLSSTYTVGKTFAVNASDLQSDGSFRGSFQIPADELTNAGQTLTASMFNLYNIFPGKEYYRGESLKTNVVDTSVLPTIDSVFLSKSNATNATAVTSLDEGDTFYVHVLATGLNSTGANVNIALAWDGTSSAADFDIARPTSINMSLVNASTRQYRGVSGPIGIVEDNQEG